MSTPIFQYQNYQMTLSGVATPITVSYETTSQEVSKAYNLLIQQIAAVFNKEAAVDSNGVISKADITQADADSINSALTALKLLAQNGITDSSGKVNYLNAQMATNLDELIRTFNAVGYNNSTITVSQLEAWKDLSVITPQLTQIISSALDADAANRSLQALIEMEYIGTANQLVEDKLGGLETALTTTSDTLNTLAALQDVHNKIIFTNKQKFYFDYTGADSDNKKDYFNSYKAAASAYFGTPVKAAIPASYFITSFRYSNQVGVPTPIIIITLRLSPAGIALANQLIKLKASIQLQLQALDKILTATQKLGTGNLYSQLTSVLNDLNTGFVDENGDPISATSDTYEMYQGLSNWLLDKYNNTDDTSAGAIQQNITKAISSAQSLNDTQKQDVQNYLFVFEEYYKSASSILQKITDIIEKMAQGIRS